MIARIVLVLMLGALAQDPPAATSTALIVVNRSDYGVISDRLDQYKADVERRWPSVRITLVASRDWTRAADLRAMLRERLASTTPPLEGAILVGALPFMRYRTDDSPQDYPDRDGNVAVCPMYYQDLDGSFEPGADGVLDPKECAQGDRRGAEIWVSFIRPDRKGDAGLLQLRSYFDKTHRYYAGDRKYNGRVLLWQTLDVEPCNADVRELEGPFTRAAIDHYGKDDVVVDAKTGVRELRRSDLTKVERLTPENCPVPGWKYHGPANPFVAQLQRVSGAYYDLYEVHYGGGYFHAYLLTDHVKKMKASPKIVCLNACRTGQFDYDPAKSISLAYLFETDGTLAVMGPTVEASWSQLYNLVYRYMAEGDPLGRAWLRKERLQEMEERDVAPSSGPGRTTYHDHTIPAHGSTLMGDPFVRLKD